MTDKQSKDKVAIREIFTRWSTAARNKDLDGIMALYSDDICSYDAVGPLQFKGRDDYRAHWERCMAFDDEFIMEPQEPLIRISGHLAVARFLIRCGMRKEDGTEQASWMRSSYHLEKHDGQWRIMHEHFSVPFDFENGSAQFGLQP
ncbi:SgcJ/EcaC family oxidoreductase [Thalassospira sp. SN3W]|uniref:YybH family protein n=1 Tax=Thalassospira sp. SN3W TaxID=3035476 RepID=UPI00311B09DB